MRSDPKSQLPNPQSPLLWGATAEKRRRKRKTAESASRTAAQKKADRLNEAERQRKIRNYLQGQAILKAQEEAARKEDDDPYAGMDDWYEKQDKINAGMLAEVPELQRWAEKQKAIKAQKDAELDSATRSYMAMGAAVASGEFSQKEYDSMQNLTEEKRIEPDKNKKTIWIPKLFEREARALVQTIPSVPIGSKRIEIPIANFMSPSSMISAGLVLLLCLFFPMLYQPLFLLVYSYHSKFFLILLLQVQPLDLFFPKHWQRLF